MDFIKIHSVHIWGHLSVIWVPFGWAWCCLSRKLFRSMPVRWSLHPAVGAIPLFCFLFGFSFVSQKLQPAVQKGKVRPTKKTQKGCCSQEIRIKGPSLPQATLSTSIEQLVVSFPCEGRFWSWPRCSPPCRCTIPRCSTGPLWG